MVTTEAIMTHGASVVRSTFRVSSHCARCAHSLEQALRTTDGVALAAVLPRSRETVVDYDPNVVTAEDLLDAIRVAGFEVEFVDHI